MGNPIPRLSLGALLPDRLVPTGLLPDGAVPDLIGGLSRGAQATLGRAARSAGLSRRGVWSTAGRHHIEVRGVAQVGGERLARRVESALARHPGVNWARVNAPSGRVVVSVGEPKPPLRELISIVARVERSDDFEPDNDRPPPHPPEEGPRTGRALSTLAADALGLTLAAATRVLPFTPVPGEVAGLLNVIEMHPKLRALAGQGLRSHHRAESVLPLVEAVAVGLTGGWAGILLDGAQRLLQWGEARAQCAAWEQAEPALAGTPEQAAAPPVVDERPRPKPDGPAERYLTRILSTGTLLGGVVLPAAGRKRAAALALSTLPKAPIAGREAYAAQLGLTLARRGVIAMDRTVLRELDRIDTLVLDVAALQSPRGVLVDLVPLPGTDAEQAAIRAFGLFDPTEPTAVRRADGWSLGPLTAVHPAGPTVPEPTDSRPDAPDPAGNRSGASGPAEVAPDAGGPDAGGPDAGGPDAGGPDAGGPDDKATAASDEPIAATVDRLGADGGTLLGLTDGGRLVALVRTEPEPMPGVEALPAAARRAGLRLVVAGGDERRHGYADQLVPGGSRLVASVRELQADGSMVMLVSANRRALGAADCGLGVCRPGAVTPWGAHLLVGTDLAVPALVVEAAGIARELVRRHILLAGAGTGLGALAAFTSARSQLPGRTMLAVNAAAGVALAHGVWRARQVPDRAAPSSSVPVPWHLMPVDTVLARLDTGPAGLPAGEARRRRRPTGAGQVDGVSLVRALVDELSNPLTPVLVAGAGLSAAVGSVVDAALVGGVVGVSSAVGAAHRVATERSLAALLARSAVTARVRRAGSTEVLPADELVAGDVIEVEPGDAVPADCRLIEAVGLETDESSLTGESLPVAKTAQPVVAAEVAERHSMLYEGTTVAAGRGCAVVVATGPDTEVGRGMALARQAPPSSGVEARLLKLTRASIPLAAGSAVAVAGAGLLRGVPLAESAATAANLAVASVPEGLPFLVGAAQLAAARRLAEHGALVRNPRTIEALGRVDVLCFDKTGTLTEGQLLLAGVGDGGRYAPVEELDDRLRLVLAAALRATPAGADPPRAAQQTDLSVSAGARAAGVVPETGAPGWRETATLPFEPSRGYHATTGSSDGTRLLNVKGAPETILPRCTRRRTPDGDLPLDDAGRRDLQDLLARHAGSGHRLLAVAERALPAATADGGTADAEPVDTDVAELTFVGFLTLADGVRASAAPAVRRIREAGVHTIMITGDHPGTARAIASIISPDGPEPRVITATELDRLDDDALADRLSRTDVVARCTPAHKVLIIQTLQKCGRTVAMTGDGANDAPAIRLADVGIALGKRGTPAARAAADLVVTDDRLETIIATLIEGRAMWSSVRHALSILVGGNLGEIAFSVLTAAATGRSALTGRQLLLVNLLTDLAPAMAIAVRPPRPESTDHLLHEGPDASLGGTLAREVALRAASTTLGATTGWTLARFTGRRQRASTVALAALVGTQLGQTLIDGGASPTVLASTAGSLLVLTVVIQTPGVSHFFGCTPLGPVGWAIATGSALGATLTNRVLDRLPIDGLLPTEPS
ncbi:HAD-IC family P-type ATPase [Solwaraspora sp. WMMD1047]|uniref:HAD-IC family P-type ATPase n=1 Tax=Solwaraspora sp. WMMD1047 TaxID=3016102 RepID=UPI002415DEBB|nr:HAD-IC family P-type ATPase [Solwaraspora sp. WMMD1047]MDG4834696.1 HAD-IC family P-type ATPase [Solwaraspora sp. WMMD1047]